MLSRKRTIVVAAAAGAIIGCGTAPAVDPLSPVGDASAEGAAPMPFEPVDGSAVPGCEGARTPDGGCQCTGLSVAVQTQASCSISILPGFAMDGEGFITVAGQKHRVFAIDRAPKGHVIAWCDATTNKSLIGAFDARGYLAQRPTPKVAAFGYKLLCSPPYVPDDVAYLGADLPVQYQNHPEKLAADYDALVFCGFAIPWTWDFAQVLVDYVTVHGRGLLLSMDYHGPPGITTTADFQKMNAIAKHAGIAFDPVKLDWAQASLDFKVECVPDLPQPR